MTDAHLNSLIKTMQESVSDAENIISACQQDSADKNLLMKLKEILATARNVQKLLLKVKGRNLSRDEIAAFQSHVVIVKSAVDKIKAEIQIFNA